MREMHNDRIVAVINGFNGDGAVSIMKTRYVSSYEVAPNIHGRCLIQIVCAIYN